ncbi:Uncharacterized protein PECH_008351 [Penicillium ucsense]|uniref:histidine kinase n=1 Tax=Penicillium ucsense TaxID=2839758 RepID=A0A8J8WHL5_9EURO|nr:Uncharacterized protein PECM_008139 [Penicillium ucsense]KAF7734250.1 Uncharacterized protein PECH_008351 [Penicillium ucsense]
MGDVRSGSHPSGPLQPGTVSTDALSPSRVRSAKSSTAEQSVHENDVSKVTADDKTGHLAQSSGSEPQLPRFSRGDSGENLRGLTPITEDTRPESEQLEEQGRSSQTLKELKRQMEELLVYQQMQQHQNQGGVANQSAGGLSNDAPKKRRLSHVTTEVPLTILGPSSGSVGSAGTIKADDNYGSATTDHTVFQTPSYPFPRVQNQGFHPDLDQAGRSGQFRLKLPSERLRSSTPGSQGSDDHHPSPRLSGAQPAFLPQTGEPLADDSDFPTPNLYDLTLRLNAEPGLDAWWANLTDILQAHYGAERVSLAVPGDLTDLENVPWGQKAVFNQNVPSTHQDTQSSAASCRRTSTVHLGAPSQYDDSFHGSNPASTPGLKSPMSARPPLESRHSFAGFAHSKRAAHTSEWEKSQETPKAPTRGEKKNARTPGSLHPTEIPPGLSGTRFTTVPPESYDVGNAAPSQLRNAVFTIPRPLEVEPDPLVKRAGVVKLFGRSTPVILTREYTADSIDPLGMDNGIPRSPHESIQRTPNAEGPDASTSAVHGQKAPTTRRMGTLRSRDYEEYEQIPQSPWSQSPAPSPAPRTHADQNPFFTSHTVDEGAFSKNPPHHDYSNSRPLEAIGVDYSKTVVHIPLLHGAHSDSGSFSTLRFPVAVVSILSPIVPYPANLRQSLVHFMPHLTSSFCLAQHYSQLERQLASKVETPRFGHLLGLGGTFSDASSELELVAGLSGHMNYATSDHSSMSAQASITSPSDRSSNKLSPAISALGTPGFDLGYMGLNSATQSPALFSRGGEHIDSYFHVQHMRSSRDTGSTQKSRLSKTKSALSASTPTSPGRLPSKTSNNEDDNAGQESASNVASPTQDSRPQHAFPPNQPSRQGSTNSFYTQLQRELPRPFSDTIAQLMLNSVPLHLFLAKPQSGEVIWTNAKFDAYRRGKPQEQRLRDPWQNIHSSEREHVSNQWLNALRTGCQFTERVRVRRFNDETAYRWFIFRANPLLSSTGEVLYWIGSFLDIHEQHIAELKAAQEREKFATDAKYRAFSNSIPQVVFEATENKGLIFVNEQWNLYTGQSLDEALNLGFAKHVHPNDLEKCGGLATQASQPVAPDEAESKVNGEPGNLDTESHRVSSALDELVRRGVASLQKDENGRVFYSTEIRLRSRGGDYRWHLVRLVRVETGSFGKEEASWYGTCTDINDRKNLERELNKAMTQLNNQMESKTKFFSNMSHEIRTPLNGILGTIPFILDTQLDTDQRRMLDTIQNSSTNLRELVDNILDVSRVEAGKMSMVNSWFHVRSMIEDVIDTVASRAIDKGLEINYLMEANVASMVIGDRFRIRQVLINLVGNAVKFTTQGEVYIRCNLVREPAAKLKNTEAFLSFDVVDTGKGFSSQDAERLMQRFSQLGENGSQQHAGSGLGLFLSKQLVEMHGGKLIPSSKEGQGAQFSFNVKVDAPPPPSPAERPSLLRQASSVSRRPATSRTTSYDQSNLHPPRNQDHILNMASLSRGLESPGFELGPSGLYPASAMSSALPTPDLQTPSPPFSATSAHSAGEALDVASGKSGRLPTSPSQGSISGLHRPSSHGPLSIMILCPLDNTRKATKQHIEQVVPHEIPFTIITLVDIDEWKDAIQSGSGANCTHLVLNLPSNDDISEVIQCVSQREPGHSPVMVIISDLYQKRQISGRVKDLAATGRSVYIVPKPVKPSSFSPIFDPDSKRELSKDRNQDMAREINNNFKTVSKMVKEVLGNKGYRVLLVEDDETNRDVMLKYLDKIKLMSETASNGQECTDMVLSKEPGYYSLIICDIQMPIKNGYDTCREIRAWEQKNHYPQIPIMALSANAMTDQIENAARAGFNDYVTKPIKHNELGKMMMGLLDPSRPLSLLRDRLNGGGADAAQPNRR